MRPSLRRPGSLLVALLIALALGALVSSYALVSEGAGKKSVAAVAQYEPPPSSNPPRTDPLNDKCKKAKKKLKRAKRKVQRAKRRLNRADTARQKSQAKKKLKRAKKKLKRAKKRKRKACRR